MRRLEMKLTPDLLRGDVDVDVEEVGQGDGAPRCHWPRLFTASGDASSWLGASAARERGWVSCERGRGSSGSLAGAWRTGKPLGGLGGSGHLSGVGMQATELLVVVGVDDNGDLRAGPG